MKPITLPCRACLLVVLACALLSGCVHLSLNEIDAKRAEAIRRIGVISAAADQLFQVHEGATFLNHRIYSQSIEAWKLDDVLAEQVTQATRALGRYEVIKPAYERERLLVEVNKLTLADIPYVYSSKWREFVAPHLREIAARENLDAVEILLRAPGCAIGTTGLTQGIGIYTASGGAAKAYNCTALFLIDGKSGEVIVARRPIDMRPKYKAGQTALISLHPSRDMSRDLALIPLAQLTRAQQDDLRAVLLDFLADTHSIDEAVREMFKLRGKPST